MLPIAVALLLLQSPDVDALIRKLGSPELSEREAATRALREKGESIRPQLEKAATDADSEVAARVKALLRDLERFVDGLGSAIERIGRESGGSHQRALRDITHASAAIFQGKNLRPMIPSLERQGFKIDRWRDEGGVSELRLGAPKGGFVSPAGLELKLELNVVVDYVPSPTEPTKEIVRRAWAVYRSQEKMDLASLLAKPFSEGTALARALAHDKTREGQAEHPVVEELKMEYHQFGSHRDPTLDWGFDVVIRLADREHTAGYLSMFFFASGLDANQPLGLVESPPGFVSKDTIELAYQSGSSSWRMTWGTDARRLRRQDYKEPGYGYQIYVEAPKARGGGDLAALPDDLATLTVKGSAFTGENGPALLRFKKLRSLWWEVDPTSLAGDAFYSELPSLDRLDLECVDVDDELILRISRMKRLTRLFIRHAEGVTDEGWSRLAALENLTYLGAWHGNQLTDKALESLAGLRKLESLHFARCPGFKDAGLAAVSRLSNLRNLSFSGVDGFTPQGLKHLEKMRLEDLDFTFVPLGDAGFESVGRIATLQELSLHGLDNLTDAGLAHLKGLKGIKELNLYRCPGVTTKGLKDLQAAWPGTYELK